MWAWHSEDQPSTLGASQPTSQPASYSALSLGICELGRPLNSTHCLHLGRHEAQKETPKQGTSAATNSGVAEKWLTNWAHGFCVVFLVGKHSKTWSIGLIHTHLGAAWSWARGNIISNSWALGVAFRLVILYCFCGGQLCWWSGRGAKQIKGTAVQWLEVSHSILRLNHDCTKSLHDIALTYDRYIRLEANVENQYFFCYSHFPTCSQREIQRFKTCWSLFKKRICHHHVQLHLDSLTWSPW